MKSARDWIVDSPPLNDAELVRSIQADALRYAATTIQDAFDEGLPIESALALVRIKAGNLTKRSHVSPVSDNPKEDAFYEKVEASITTNQT